MKYQKSYVPWPKVEEDQQGQNVLICPRCKVDRLKDPCPDNSLNCPMQAEAQQAPN